MTAPMQTPGALNWSAAGIELPDMPPIQAGEDAMSMTIAGILPTLAASLTTNVTALSAKENMFNAKLSDAKFVEGFGSIGGEEFFSYLNISDSLKRTGGKEWGDWHSKITQKILKLKNNDGTWAGHHCITGRVAVTSAAILNLTSEREN